MLILPLNKLYLHTKTEISSAEKKRKMQNPNSAGRGEGERLLAIAEKLLHSRDLVGARDFAILAQENEPLLEASDQILAVSEVLISSEKRVDNGHHDWYSILQIDRMSDDLDLIRKQYRRLALLLQLDKNKFPFADQALKLVADAWATLSDPVRKSQFDQLLIPSPLDNSVSGRADWPAQQSQGFQMNFSTPQPQPQLAKYPVKRAENHSRSKQNGVGRAANGNANDNMSLNFWTACPYCYTLHEYPQVYEGCCLRCQSCQRAFHGAEIPALPPLAPGKEAYYCCWASFPVGFKSSRSEHSGKGFPNWMPPIFNNSGSNMNGDPRPIQLNSPTTLPGQQTQVHLAAPLRVGVEMSSGAGFSAEGTKKKRGRPKKNPF